MTHAVRQSVHCLFVNIQVKQWLCYRKTRFKNCCHIDMNMILIIWIETKPQRTNESKLYWLDARTRKRDLLSTDHHYRSSSYTEIMLMVLYLCIHVYLIATRDDNRENDIFFQFAAVCCLLVFCFLLGHTMGNSCLGHFKFSFLFLASADKFGFKH